MGKELKITKEMVIEDIIQKYPKTTFVFLDYGLHCIGCPLAQDETIEEAVKVHQINLQKLLEDLNKATNNKQKL
jgi:hybrid cluster-associated redox disulfide protein